MDLTTESSIVLDLGATDETSVSIIFRDKDELTILDTIILPRNKAVSFLSSLKGVVEELIPRNEIALSCRTIYVSTTKKATLEF